MSDQPEAMLIVGKGLSSREPLFLTEESQILGNSTSADIPLSNPFVSRRHCRIRFHGGEFRISDLGSKNGTYVNGIPLKEEEERPLKNGDTIELAVDSVLVKFQSVSECTIVQTATVTVDRRNIRVDQGSREVWIRGDQITPPLSPKEFDVLALLSSRQGEVVSKDDIASGGWPEREGDVGNHEIEQCVRRIRRRIEEDPGNPKLLITRKGVGYQLT